jgi:hypothetical protein
MAQQETDQLSRILTSAALSRAVSSIALGIKQTPKFNSVGYAHLPKHSTR